MNATSGNQAPSATRKVSTVARIFATVTFVVGAILLFVSIGLDLDGFWGGMLQGASVALLIVGAYIAGMVGGMRRANSAQTGTWLPSQDSPA